MHTILDEAPALSYTCSNKVVGASAGKNRHRYKDVLGDVQWYDTARGRMACARPFKQGSKRVETRVYTPPHHAAGKTMREMHAHSDTPRR